MRPPQRSARLLIGAVTVGLLTPALALALPPATGSQASIAIETAAEHVYEHVAAVRTDESGGLIIPDTGLSWRTLRSSVPGGWSSARLVIVDALKNGVSTWEEEVFVPSRHGVAPLEVLQTQSGVYARRSTSAGCFQNVEIEGGGQVGQPLFAVFGHYDSPRYSGGTVSVTGTYPYSSGGYATVTETDVLGARSHAYVSVRQRFAAKAGSRLKPVVSVSHFTSLDHAPARPAISYCPITGS